MKKILLLSTFLFSIFVTNAQRGKDGSKLVTASEVVNAYTFLTANANAGDTIITVDNSNLNTHFSGNIATGDLIMIIQVQGVSIIDMPMPGQTTDWGRITNYNNCGNYEFVEIESVPNATSLISTCGLKNSYTATDKVVIVRVPRYNTLTINAGGKITADAWNGNVGGILAIEVLGTTTIDGTIDVSDIGFRGGQNKTSSGFGGLRYAQTNPLEGAEKGEGIAGSQADYDTKFNGRYCRGAAANAGGGGNGHNSGGAGGANGGDINLWHKGLGTPDVSTANNITAWGLDTGIISINVNPSLVISSGGGRGGYSHCSSNQNELTIAPNNTNWSGDFRRDNGGLGGRPLDYSTGKIFMAGAGGAGEANDVYGGSGGRGAGIIFIKSYNTVSGTGAINANGQKGGDCSGPASPGFGQYSGKDAAGGGGAGGTVIIESTGTVSGITINANGGKGGDQIMTAGAFASIQEAEGPGGGGSGGYVAISNGTPTINSSGGTNGTTNSPLIANFPPNGATKGGAGISIGTTTAYDLIAINESICSNNTATLSAAYSGTAPIGGTIEWYDAEFGGNLLQTGTTFTTPILSVQTTYYVKSCPGSFTVPVTVFINTCGTPPVTNISSSDSIFCVNSCIDFTDLSINTPSAWSWHFFGANTTTSTLQNPTNICYNTAGTFDVALVSSNPSGSDSLYLPNFITVNALPTIITSPDTAICKGDTVYLSASGGNSYTWNNGLGVGQNQTANPVIHTIYTVFVTDVNLCFDSAQINVLIHDLPTVVASADTTICLGDAVNLSANGAVSYVWDNGLGLGQNQNPSPISNTTYTVIGIDTNLCSNSDQVNVIVGVCGFAPITSFSSSDNSVCIGSCVNFTDLSVNLPTSWSWYFFGSNTPNSTSQNPTNICYNTAGSFDVALVSSNSTGSDSLFLANFITINNLPLITTSPDTAICKNSSVNLSANGAISYVWDNGLGAGQSHTSSPIVNTIYTVVGTDTNNCVNSAQVNVTINLLPIIFTSPDTAICLGDTVKLRASGVLTYLWDNGLGNIQNPSATPIVPTSYAVIGTDINNCSSSVQINVTINSLPTIVASNDVTICSGDTTAISASGGFIYSWDNGLGLGPSKMVFPTTTTLYTVAGANAFGCRDTDQVMVFVNICTLPVTNFSTGNTSICIDDCIDFTDLTSGSPTSWMWYFNGATPLTSNVQNPTNICYNTVGSFDIKLVTTNAFGSDSSIFVNYISVDSCLIPAPTVIVVPEVVAPNVFSPNGDGQNDLFAVGGVGISAVSMKIFNRWGQNIFTSSQPKEGWDGRTNSGSLCPEGTYFYIIEVKTSEETKTYKGYLTLIR